MKELNNLTFQSAVYKEQAACAELTPHLAQLGTYLDEFMQFNHQDAQVNASQWQGYLNKPLPEHGVGITQVIEDFGQVVIPNGSAIAKPGFSSFITTGATTMGALATLCGSIAAPQRIGLNAFNYLETLSLTWMAELLGLEPTMKGIYSSGGSVANLIALGAARQAAFEAIGIDPAKEGIRRTCRLYASADTHKTINRAAAVLGLGRNAVVTIVCDSSGRMDISDLRNKVHQDTKQGLLPIAIVANAGSTSTGAIDPLNDIGKLAANRNIWFHIDGAYGLPGILDTKVTHLYDGLQLADSVIIDPHKWLGAPVGIGATYVKDYGFLYRSFTQELADYLDGSVYDSNVEHSMDSLGVPFNNLGVELSAPCRGAVVWAMLNEVGRKGIKDRVCRHNAMASHMAQYCQHHQYLEVLQQPTLSICCFRYTHPKIDDLNAFNRAIHRQLLRNNQNLPSTTMIGKDLALRPCFIGAKTDWQQVNNLLNEVISIGNDMVKRIKVSSLHQHGPMAMCW